jgi:hypothetical protein
VDVDPVFGHVDRSTQVPEVVSLPLSATLQSVGHSLDDCVGTYTIYEPLSGDVDSEGSKRVESILLRPS